MRLPTRLLQLSRTACALSLAAAAGCSTMLDRDRLTHVPPAEDGSDTNQTCPAGQVACSFGCVDLATDVENCGTCNHRCGFLASCQGGGCVCPLGGTLCDVTICTDSNWDPRNCGGCGISCGVAELCFGGTCDCMPSFHRSGPGGDCRNDLNDSLRCGVMGFACITPYVCVAGSCRDPSTCAFAGLTLCGDACTDTSLDLYNCGSCGNVCGAGTVCLAGCCKSVNAPLGCGWATVPCGTTRCPCPDGTNLFCIPVDPGSYAVCVGPCG